MTINDHKVESLIGSGYPLDVLLRAVARRCIAKEFSIELAHNIVDGFYLRELIDVSRGKNGKPNRCKAARLGGMHRNTLDRRLKKLPESVRSSLLKNRVKVI